MAALEVEYAEQLDLDRPCVAVRSNATGLLLGLLAADLTTGDEVVVPAFASPVIARAVRLAGGVPVFADIDPGTYCIDPTAVEARLTRRTVGIVAVHRYGHPADLTRLTAVAARHGLRLFEQAPEAHGLSWAGRPVGSFGTFGVFSVSLAEAGREAGMLAVGSLALRAGVRALRGGGLSVASGGGSVGADLRLGALAASAARRRLAEVGAAVERRRATAAFLAAHLRGVGTPVVDRRATHGFSAYPIRVPEDRPRLADLLGAELGVAPMTLLPTTRPWSAAGLPHTERAAAEVLSLPLSSSGGLVNAERLVRCVDDFVRAGA